MRARSPYRWAALAGALLVFGAFGACNRGGQDRGGSPATQGAQSGDPSAGDMNRERTGNFAGSSAETQKGGSSDTATKGSNPSGPPTGDNGRGSQAPAAVAAPPGQGGMGSATNPDSVGKNRTGGLPNVGPGAVRDSLSGQEGKGPNGSHGTRQHGKLGGVRSHSQGGKGSAGGDPPWPGVNGKSAGGETSH